MVLVELSFKNSFLILFFFSNLMLPWHSNTIITGKKTKNWVDNHPMIISAKYGSHHFNGYGENATEAFSHYMSMEVFCCHGNQIKRQTGRLIVCVFFFQLPLLI